MFATKNRRRVVARQGGPSKTKTDMQKSTDVNNIMKQYQRTGLVSHVARQQGEYGEYTEIDFQEAMNTVIKAEEMFMELPAEIRKEFENDPAKFLKFVESGDEEKMRELGLLPPVSEAQREQQKQEAGVQDADSGAQAP